MSIQSKLLEELHLYFYYNQYDEDRFPHFRACDLLIEYDYEGNEYKVFQFFD
jgi:hypothetical protein